MSEHDTLPSTVQHELYATCRRREASELGLSAADVALAAPPLPNRTTHVIVWDTTDGSALGNGLNVFMITYLFALFTRRRVVAGPGLVPGLLCGPKGAFTPCGAPGWLEVLKGTRHDAMLIMLDQRSR